MNYTKTNWENNKAPAINTSHLVSEAYVKVNGVWKQIE